MDAAFLSSVKDTVLLYLANADAGISGITKDGSCLFHGDHDDLNEMSHYSIKHAQAFVSWPLVRAFN